MTSNARERLPRLLLVAQRLEHRAVDGWGGLDADRRDGHATWGNHPPGMNQDRGTSGQRPLRAGWAIRVQPRWSPGSTGHAGCLWHPTLTKHPAHQAHPAHSARPATAQRNLAPFGQLDQLGSGRPPSSRTARTPSPRLRPSSTASPSAAIPWPTRTSSSDWPMQRGRCWPPSRTQRSGWTRRPRTTCIGESPRGRPLPRGGPRWRRGNRAARRGRHL